MATISRHKYTNRDGIYVNDNYFNTKFNSIYCYDRFRYFLSNSYRTTPPAVETLSESS